MPAVQQVPIDAPTTAKLSKGDQAEIDALNTSIDRMRRFTAPDPYTLTIPQDVEPRYHHAYQYQATQWLHQAPFEWKEGEYTQYQTFFYHEHGKDMYVLHNSQPREEREAAGAKSKPATGANTPDAGPKKKISLNAYKKKQTRAGTPAQQELPPVKQAEAPVKQSAVKSPVERIKAETEKVLAAVEEPEEAPLAAAPPVKELKRKREEEESVREDKQAKAPPVASVREPATKKVRTSSPPPAPASTAKLPSPPRGTDEVAEKVSTPMAQTEDAGLPPRLSPLQRVEDMPSRLSPTIPANIKTTLKVREQCKTSSSDASATGSVTKNGTLTPPRQGESITKRKSPIPRNGFRANSSSPAVRSDAEERTKPAVTSAPQRPKTSELSQDDEIAVGRAVKATKQVKPSMIVKLKYKKHQREAVRRILKMRPNAAKTATPQPAPAPPKAAEESKPDRPAIRRRDPTAKGVAQKIGPPARKQVDKRNVTVQQLLGKEAASDERPARSKQPEIKRYEPPGRRKDSTAEVASEESLGKRKRAPEEPHTRSDEPPPSRKDAPTGETLNQEPPAKRQKGPERQHTEHDEPSLHQKHTPAVEPGSAEAPAKRKRVLEEQPGTDGSQPNGKQSPRTETRQEEPSGGRKDSSKGKEPLAQLKPSEKAQASADGRVTERKDVPPAAEVQHQKSPKKRKNVPEAIETNKAPSTPVQPDLQSPFMPSSVQKSQQATPTLRKDHLSAVAMVREVSAEGVVNTPSSGASSTPMAVNGITSQPNGISTKAPSSQPSAKTTTQQAWESEQKRLEALGRGLKHAATAHLNKLKLAQSDPNGPTNEQKLAAVKSVESLVAYFLAFTSADEAALAAEPKQNPMMRNWRTLHGFFGFVKRNCEPTPLLLGLACHLGVVFSAHILEIAQFLGKQAVLDVAAETHGALFKNARDADAKLDCDALQESFPRTWKMRSRVPAGVEQMTPGEFKGEYKLPLGVQTTPIRAARAGYAMLEEWIAKEKLEYELKLKL